MEIKITYINALKILGAILFIITVLSLVGQLYKYQFNEGEDNYLIDMISLGSEDNLPAIYESVTIFFAAVLSMIISSVWGKAGLKYYQLWKLLVVILTLLALDEQLQIHETLIEYFGFLSNASPDYFKIFFVLFLILIVIISLQYLKLVLELQKTNRNLFLFAGIVYLLGAIGIKSFGYNIRPGSVNDNFFISSIIMVEELFEKLGILIFIYAQMKLLKEQVKELKIIFD